MNLAAAVEVAAPADMVFEAAVDWEAQSRWIPLTTVRVTGGDGRSAGSTLVARTGVGPMAIIDDMVVEVWHPPSRCEVRHDGRVVRGRGLFVVEPLGEARSRFRWEEQLPDGATYGVIARVTAPLNRAMLAVALRRFARWVEAGRP